MRIPAMRIPAQARLAGTITALLVVATACSTATGTHHPPAAAGAPPPPATTAAGPGASVAARTDPLGTILVDGSGRTLYLFEKDTSTTSTCTGACASAWPPVTTTGTAQVGAGASAGLLATTARSDGSTQLTYAGHPLYYFAGDAAEGDTLGQGLDQFGAGWYVLSPDGNKIDND